MTRLERLHQPSIRAVSDEQRREMAEAIVAEYELIQQKRSKLSRVQRERVVELYARAREICENGEERVD